MKERKQKLTHRCRKQARSGTERSLAALLGLRAPCSGCTNQMTLPVHISGGKFTILATVGQIWPVSIRQFVVLSQSSGWLCRTSDSSCEQETSEATFLLASTSKNSCDHQRTAELGSVVQRQQSADIHTRLSLMTSAAGRSIPSQRKTSSYACKTCFTSLHSFCDSFRACVYVCVCVTVFKLKIENQPLLCLALVKVPQLREQRKLSVAFSSLLLRPPPPPQTGV